MELREKSSVLYAITQLIVIAVVLSTLPVLVPQTASAASSERTVTLLRENFENPRWTCATPWDQDDKEMWVRGDSNKASGEDYWCFSQNRIREGDAHSGGHSAWCAVVGSNSVASAQEGRRVNNLEIYRYDTSMSAYMRHSLNPLPDRPDPELRFWYWSVTGTHDGFDRLSVSVSADNATYTTVWTQPGPDSGGWQEGYAVIPSDARTISFDFTSGADIPPGGLREGAYIDDILVTQAAGEAPWSRVEPLPPYSGAVFDVTVTVDASQGMADSIALFYDRGSGYLPYSNSAHPDGRFPTGEKIAFDTSLTGGDGTYQLYSLASRGSWIEVEPSSPDAVTTVDTAAPRTIHMVSEDYEVSLEASDPTSGVASTRWRLDGGEWMEYSAPLLVDERDHVLEFYSVDRAGNREIMQAVALNRAMTDGPVIVLGPLSPSYNAGEEVLLTWICTSLSAPIDHFTIMIDGREAGTLGANASSFALTGMPPGKHMVTVRAVDGRGASAEKSAAVTVAGIASGSPPDIGLVAVIALPLLLVLGALVWWRTGKRR